jgi:hypothetical protein
MATGNHNVFGRHVNNARIERTRKLRFQQALPRIGDTYRCYGKHQEEWDNEATTTEINKLTKLYHSDTDGLMSTADTMVQGKRHGCKQPLPCGGEVLALVTTTPCTRKKNANPENYYNRRKRLAGVGGSRRPYLLFTL